MEHSTNFVGIPLLCMVGSLPAAPLCAVFTYEGLLSAGPPRPQLRPLRRRHRGRVAGANGEHQQHPRDQRLGHPHAGFRQPIIGSARWLAIAGTLFNAVTLVNAANPHWPSPPQGVLRTTWRQPLVPTAVRAVEEGLASILVWF
jgi:hypothetical protein